MKEPTPQPRRRDAAVIVAMLLVGATIYLTILGPLGGRAGWLTLLAIAAILALTRLADPWIRRFSRKIQGKGKRNSPPPSDSPPSPPPHAPPPPPPPERPRNDGRAT